MLENLLPKVVAIAVEAGHAIMEVYADPANVATAKTDNSPLTLADLASDRVISDGLNKLETGWPLLSEEAAQIAYAERQTWQRFWLIDPLDGTKEFVKRNGEFTVNIALIENGVPVLGVVYAPALDVCYYAAQGEGAFVRRGSEVQAISARPHIAGQPIKVVASRSHSDERTTTLLKQLGAYECVSMGSSLKLCLVAEGAAHFYPRLGPTMEWDTAAAHAVVNQAGGAVCAVDGVELRYNKADLHNPEFLVMPALDKVRCLADAANSQHWLEFQPATLLRSPEVTWHQATVTRARREAQNGHRGAIIWFTGLSGAGKSTLAHAVEEFLHQQGCHTFVLDGDNMRHGLCGDLGFSAEARVENIRRVGEVAKIFVDAGVIVLTAFISPYRADRARVRAMVKQLDFIEVYCDSPLEICEQRDVKGIYKKARAGQIADFTGISSPYEAPKFPELVVNTGGEKLELCVRQVIVEVERFGIITTPNSARLTS